MPRKAKKPCGHPGCQELIEIGDRYCSKHSTISFFKQDNRPSASKRGYNSKWQQARKSYLSRHPLCVRCQAKGKYTQATVVDHITPHRGDKNLFWDSNNWQPLCKACHDHKTWAEDVKLPYRY